MNGKMLWLMLATLWLNYGYAADKPIIKLGVMASGTLAWELAAVNNAGLLDNSGFTIENVALSNQQAGKVALQSGNVDMIVSDWIWVSSMRAEGADYSFYPYSNASGGLLVPAGSSIKTLADLKAKKLGIAGGELDKNWLLLQALGLKQGIELNKNVDKVFGAPPLLNQQLSEQRLDALLTYWQFAARLEAQGYQQLLSGEDIIRQLGITESVPSLGYVFKDSWAQQHKDILRSFLRVTEAARDKLCSDDAAWAKIEHLTEAGNPQEQQHMRQRYCQGRVSQWTDANRKAAEQIYQQLHQLGDNKLTGKNAQIQTGTFWLMD